MKTSDVYLASALLSLKYELVNIDRTNPKHMVFEFSAGTSENLGDAVRTYNIENVEKQWANRTLTGNLNDFSEAIKRMKSLIHSS